MCGCGGVWLKRDWMEEGYGPQMDGDRPSTFKCNRDAKDI